MDLRAFATLLGCGKRDEWAHKNYKSTIIELSRTFHLPSWLEIGGGREPLFSEREVSSLGVHYSVNDISEKELALAPTFTNKIAFDIQGNVIPTAKYDLIFSKFLLEHLSDTRKAYENIWSILRDGGVCINFYPTLYSPPFVLNKLLPEAFTRAMIRRQGNPDRGLKFPANYSWCYATKPTSQMIKQAGFREVEVIPFYGHGYFEKIPILRDLDHALTSVSLKKDYRHFASYAFAIARR
jgi:SAM-dependent methyltransferase